ncbi:MAG TPA: bestrophin family ion channel [Actinoplanes sp.]|nr:bestrophin family ion channel [Actinoplanes sp.]
MLIKRNLSPLKVVSYVWQPALYAAAVAVAVLVLRLALPDAGWFLVPFAPIGTLAAALAIVVAFRANAAYQRWAEARTLWQGVTNNSRILARQVIAATGDAIAAGKGGPAPEVLAYQREVVLRVAAFAWTLRSELRGLDATEGLDRLLSPDEFKRIEAAENRSNMMLTDIGIMIKQGVRAERIGQFDPIVLEPNLAALNNWTGGAEKIKNTPIPRQYSFFSRAFIATLTTLLPFGLAGLLDGVLLWWLVPLSTLVSGLFILLERTSEVNDQPFANRTTDVPLTAICRDLERDLREMLGDTDLPPRPVPVDGYLW